MFLFPAFGTTHPTPTSIAPAEQVDDDPEAAAVVVALEPDELDVVAAFAELVGLDELDELPHAASPVIPIAPASARTHIRLRNIFSIFLVLTHSAVRDRPNPGAS
jgi:hypothetical protein